MAKPIGTLELHYPTIQFSRSFNNNDNDNNSNNDDNKLVFWSTV